MKKLLLFFVSVLLVTTAIAQTTYNYDFFHNLKESENVAGDLTSTCSGTYSIQALPIGINRVVYSFTKGCDLTFSDVNNHIASGSYTIELYYKLDQVAGYNKVIDFKNLAFDDGLYNWNGHFNLYPNFNTASSIMPANRYSYLAITRDASSKQMRFYLDGNTIGSYTDNTNVYLYGSNQKLVFFKDDTVSKNEHAAGSIALIRITNQALDHTALQDKFNNLAASLSVGNTEPIATTQIYPNPSSRYIHITNRQGSTYTISDMMGRILKQNSITRKDQMINTSQLPTGTYLLQLYNSKGIRTHYKIQKE